jgi:hypothetical protein
MRTQIMACLLLTTLALPACGGDDDDVPAASAGKGGSGGSTGGKGGSAGRGGSGGSGGTDGDAGEAGAPSESIEIAGTWTSNFDSTEIIDDESWSTDYGTGPTAVSIIEYSNEENVVITQNPDDDDFAPSLFSRSVWTEIENDSFNYCITDFGIETADEARELDTAPDPNDLDTGCSGFSWTVLTRE